MSPDAGGAWAACTQTQLQLEDLQQSGVECLVSEGTGSAAEGASSLTPVACRWQGMSADESSAGSATKTAWAWPSSWGICMCTAAAAPVAPFSTKQTLSSTRRRIARIDMAPL